MQNSNIRIIVAEHPRVHYPASFWVLFDTTGGAVLDMNTLTLIKEKNASEINLKDTFSLIPEDRRTNDEIFFETFEMAAK